MVPMALLKLSLLIRLKSLIFLMVAGFVVVVKITISLADRNVIAVLS